MSGRSQTRFEALDSIEDLLEEMYRMQVVPVNMSSTTAHHSFLFYPMSGYLSDVLKSALLPVRDCVRPVYTLDFVALNRDFNLAIDVQRVMQHLPQAESVSYNRDTRVLETIRTHYRSLRHKTINNELVFVLKKTTRPDNALIAFHECHMEDKKVPIINGSHRQTVFTIRADILNKAFPGLSADDLEDLIFGPGKTGRLQEPILTKHRKSDASHRLRKQEKEVEDELIGKLQTAIAEIDNYKLRLISGLDYVKADIRDFGPGWLQFSEVAASVGSMMNGVGNMLACLTNHIKDMSVINNRLITVVCSSSSPSPLSTNYSTAENTPTPLSVYPQHPNHTLSKDFLSSGSSSTSSLEAPAPKQRQQVPRIDKLAKASEPSTPTQSAENLPAAIPKHKRATNRRVFRV